MNIEISSTQEKRVAKISRLREYFGKESPEVHEWKTLDESLDFSLMSDPEIAAYLESNS